MEKDTQIQELFQKYIDNTINDQEFHELLKVFGSDLSREELREQILVRLSEKRKIADQEGLRRTLENAHIRITERISIKRPTNDIFKKIYPYVAAAAILAVGLFFYYRFSSLEEPQLQASTQVMEDADPGTNRATLTLENGNAIVLNEEQTGINVGSEGISYMDGTKITDNARVQYALLSTPRKGQYQATLPDGSKVWLNAESSLRYPTAFKGSDRRVELRGEAYFEIAHNAAKPFIVETASQQLKVLGTSFNLNAYDNEPATVTTLITGSIELGRKEDKITKSVKPDQQAVLASTKFTVTPVDVRSFIAWKEGEFRFNETPLYEVLRQIERWYDVEVDYKKIPKDIEIYAFIRRDKKLSSVIAALEQITGLKFTLKERRLMLME